MSRIRKALVLTAVIALVPAASALATKITGGSAQVTVASTTAQLLASNGISTAVLTPATQSGETFTLPVKHGRLNARTNHGSISLAGGIALSNGTSTVRVRDLTIVSDKRGVSVHALYVGHLRRCRIVGHRHPHSVCRGHLAAGVVRIATVSNPTISGLTVSGTLDITRATAHLINRLAGKTIVQAGAVLGTATATLST